MTAMTHEDISEFISRLKKLRDGLDDFNGQIAAIDGSVMRLGLLCQEAAGTCPAGAAALSAALSGLSQALRSFSGTIGNAMPAFAVLADVVARGMRVIEIEARKELN